MLKILKYIGCENIHFVTQVSFILRVPIKFNNTEGNESKALGAGTSALSNYQHKTPTPTHWFLLIKEKNKSTWSSKVTWRFYCLFEWSSALNET